MSALPILSLAISALALLVSASTAWLTIWRHGALRMAQPPSVYFGPDAEPDLGGKVFVRAFLYSTSARGHVVEGMYARLTRGDASQTFPVWVCGPGRDDLSRGAGLAVTSNGIALHHHFLLPRDGTTYRFLAGVYKFDLFALVVGRKTPVRLHAIELYVTDAQAERLVSDAKAGLYFDWSPETRKFSAHISNAREDMSERSTERLPITFSEIERLGT